MSHDYFLLWHEAESDEEKVALRHEYMQEAALCFVVPLGLHAGEAAILHQLVNQHPIMSVGYIALALVVWGFMRRLL